MNRLAPTLFTESLPFLSENEKSLVLDTQSILQCIESQNQPIGDYSFLVAPMAKAYEGYLKEFFLKVGLIDRESYASDRFRVGKTLNPSLRFKRFSIFQRLSDLHEKGEELAEVLWDAWKYGRNEIFHYFPNNLKKITHEEAEDRIYLILTAIIKSGEFLKLHRSDKFSME